MKKLGLVLLVGLVLLAGCSSSTAPATDAPKANEPSGVNASTGEASPSTEKDEKEESVNPAAAYKEALDELAKAKNGETVDFDKVLNVYNEKLKPLVQNLDSATEQQISSALSAGKDGQLDPVVVKQLFDKLMQKAFFLKIRGEFKESSENWADKAKVKEEIGEAKEAYEVLEGTVKKREAAYSIDLVSGIDGAFADLEKAVAADDQLAFRLATQVIDKSLMKTFYLATGALKDGYASKTAKEAKEDVKAAKAEQAEGWAFYQSLYGYLEEFAKDDAEFVQKQFDLQTDVNTIDPQAVNKAFVRAFSKTALGEYGEAFAEENWGKDKSVIVSMEGALFINIIIADIESILGKDAASKLTTDSQALLEAVKSKDEAKAKSIFAEIEKTLNATIAAAK